MYIRVCFNNVSSCFIDLFGLMLRRKWREDSKDEFNLTLSQLDDLLAALLSLPVMVKENKYYVHNSGMAEKMMKVTLKQFKKFCKEEN